MIEVQLQRKVLSENDRIAGELRQRFAEHGVLCLNLISSPGSGKTALLERTLAAAERTAAAIDGVPGCEVVGGTLVGRPGVAGWDPLRLRG